MKPNSFCTISTNKCKHELVIFLLTLSIHHPEAPVYILSDKETSLEILNMTPKIKLDMKWFIELDEYSNKSRTEMEGEGIWSDFQMMKARVIEKALEIEEDTLFLDSDMVILDEINDIKTKDFDFLWKDLWKTSSNNNFYKTEYASAYPTQDNHWQ